MKLFQQLFVHHLKATASYQKYSVAYCGQYLAMVLHWRNSRPRWSTFLTAAPYLAPAKLELDWSGGGRSAPQHWILFSYFYSNQQWQMFYGNCSPNRTSPITLKLIVIFLEHQSRPKNTNTPLLNFAFVLQSVLEIEKARAPWFKSSVVVTDTIKNKKLLCILGMTALSYKSTPPYSAHVTGSFETGIC